MGPADIKALASKVGLHASIQNTGSADYHRAFLTDERGVSLGRVTIYRGQYSHVKWYWREYGDLNESDYFIHSWNHALATGEPITRDQWRQLVQRAEQLSREDYQQKLQWRRDNPKPEGKRRKKLEGRSARAFIRDLVGGRIQ